MYQLGPHFIDVTWGAGGTTSDLTIEICQTAQSVYGLETCMHLTCTNMPLEKIDMALKVCFFFMFFLISSLFTFYLLCIVGRQGSRYS